MFYWLYCSCKAHVELMYPIYLYNSFCFISRDMLWPYCDADPVRVTVINKPSEQLSPKHSFTDTNQWSIFLHLHLRAGGRIPNVECNQRGVQAMHLWSEMEVQEGKSLPNSFTSNNLEGKKKFCSVGGLIKVIFLIVFSSKFSGR